MCSECKSSGRTSKFAHLPLILKLFTGIVDEAHGFDFLFPSVEAQGLEGNGNGGMAKPFPGVEAHGFEASGAEPTNVLWPLSLALS